MQAARLRVRQQCKTSWGAANNGDGLGKRRKEATGKGFGGSNLPRDGDSERTEAPIAATTNSLGFGDGRDTGDPIATAYEKFRLGREITERERERWEREK
ncbi:hypothetical protein Scep_015470 [Stephania cephalantha]|uniref:Uncharacterized protein n=1 Tax=Stephania cephalantha TaxID=152367 RepID=A0AAP0P1H4_9MAGN